MPTFLDNFSLLLDWPDHVILFLPSSFLLLIYHDLFLILFSYSCQLNLCEPSCSMQYFISPKYHLPSYFILSILIWDCILSLATYFLKIHFGILKGKSSNFLIVTHTRKKKLIHHYLVDSHTYTHICSCNENKTFVWCILIYILLYFIYKMLFTNNWIYFTTPDSKAIHSGHLTS